MYQYHFQYFLLHEKRVITSSLIGHMLICWYQTPSAKKQKSSQPETKAEAFKQELPQPETKAEISPGPDVSEPHTAPRTNGPPTPKAPIRIRLRHNAAKQPTAREREAASDDGAIEGALNTLFVRTQNALCTSLYLHFCHFLRLCVFDR